MVAAEALRVCEETMMTGIGQDAHDALKAGQPVENRHLDVQRHDVRAELDDLFDRLAAVECPPGERQARRGGDDGRKHILEQR